MSKSRDTYGYHLMVGKKKVHSGITTDHDRRLDEHRSRWPTATMNLVALMTREEALRWESRQTKTITPERKKPGGKSNRKSK